MRSHIIILGIKTYEELGDLDEQIFGRDKQILEKAFLEARSIFLKLQDSGGGSVTSFGPLSLFGPSEFSRHEDNSLGLGFGFSHSARIHFPQNRLNSDFFGIGLWGSMSMRYRDGGRVAEKVHRPVEYTYKTLLKALEDHRQIVFPDGKEVLDTKWGRIDLKNLNDITNYQGRAAPFYLARDIEMAIKHGYLNMKLTKEKFDVRKLNRLSSDMRSQLGFVSPDLSWRDFFRVAEALKKDPFGYQYDDGFARLIRDLELKPYKIDDVYKLFARQQCWSKAASKEVTEAVALGDEEIKILKANGETVEEIIEELKMLPRDDEAPTRKGRRGRVPPAATALYRAWTKLIKEDPSAASRSHSHKALASLAGISLQSVYNHIKAVNAQLTAEGKPRIRRFKQIPIPVAPDRTPRQIVQYSPGQNKLENLAQMWGLPVSDIQRAWDWIVGDNPRLSTGQLTQVERLVFLLTAMTSLYPEKLSSLEAWYLYSLRFSGDSSFYILTEDFNFLVDRMEDRVLVDTADRERKYYWRDYPALQEFFSKDETARLSKKIGPKMKSELGPSGQR